MKFERLPKIESIVWWSGLCGGAALAGLLAGNVNVPAAWLVGPMIVAVVFAVTGRKQTSVPRIAQSAAQSVVGVVLAATFEPSVLPLIAANLPSVVLVVGGTLLASLGAGFALSRRGFLDRETSAMGTLPGAASGMVVMSVPLGADPRLVALMQYTRVVLVVVSAALISRFVLAQQGAQGNVPVASQVVVVTPDATWFAYVLAVGIAALGAWAGRRLKIPAGALMGPLILGVVLRETELAGFAWPVGVPEVAYAIIGVYVGLLFDSESLRRAKRIMPAVLVSTLSLMAACAALGWLLTVLTGADPLTAYLATTPGGIDSVAITAIDSGADSSLVLALQMLRLFAVLLTAPLLARRLARRSGLK